MPQERRVWIYGHCGRETGFARGSGDVDVAVYQAWTEIFAGEVDGGGGGGERGGAEPGGKVGGGENTGYQAAGEVDGHVVLEGPGEGVDDAGVDEDVFFLLGEGPGF